MTTSDFSGLLSRSASLRAFRKSLVERTRYASSKERLSQLGVALEQISDSQGRAVVLSMMGRHREALESLIAARNQQLFPEEYLRQLSQAYCSEGRIEMAYAVATEAGDNDLLERYRILLRALDVDPVSVAMLGAPPDEDHYLGRLIGRIIDLSEVLTADTPPTRFVLATSSLGAGGAERQLTMTARGISDLFPQHHVEVVARNLKVRVQGDFYLRELTEARLRVTDLAETRPVSRRPLGVNPDAWRLLDHLPRSLAEDVRKYARFFVRMRPDVVQAWQDGTVLRAGLAAVLAGVPRLRLSFRSMPAETRALGRPYYREVLAKLAERPNVACSNNTLAGARAYESYLGCLAGSFEIIRNAVEEDQQPSSDIDLIKEVDSWIATSGPSRVIGSIMRFDANKRPGLWLEVASRLPSDTAFLLVGDGPLLESTKRLARSQGLQDRVKFTGRTAAARNLLRRMDAFMLLSRVEGLPNTLLEAQWSGVPVIAVDAGGVREAAAADASLVVTEDETRDFEQMARTVENFLADEDTLRLNGAMAAKWVRENFDYKIMVNATERWFRN